MNINLSNYNDIINKNLSIGSNCTYIKCVNINNEEIILKKHKKKNQYLNEKKNYLLLKNETFLPKLKYFDDKNRIIGTEYCGLGLNIFKKENVKKYNEIYITINNLLKDICDIMYNKYNLYHNDLIYRNIVIDDNFDIKLIDFEKSSIICKNNKYFKLNI